MIQIQNSADTAKILISGEIGESFFVDGFTLEKLQSHISDDVSNVEIEIKSLGGDSEEGIAIYDYLRSLPAKVTTKIIGRTASAGATIYMAGDDREISENSDFLIHRGQTRTVGNVDDHENSIEFLEKHDAKIANIYQKGTGKRKSQIQNLMKEERFITAKEAVEWGFAHRIIKTKKTILNQIEMDTTELKKLLKVETDDQIQTAVEALIQNSAKVAELQAVVDQVAADKAEAKKQEITNYLDEAVTGKKITAEVKDSLMALAQTDFEAVKKVVEAAKPEPLKNVVKPGEGSQEPVKLTNKVFFENYKKGIYEKDPEKYRNDYKELYGKEAKI